MREKHMRQMLTWASTCLSVSCELFRTLSCRYHQGTESSGATGEERFGFTPQMVFLGVEPLAEGEEVNSVALEAFRGWPSSDEPVAASGGLPGRGDST